jgi:deoxycytidylate deaminase
MTWYKGKVTLSTDKRYSPLLREVYCYAKKHSNDISTFTAASLINSKDETLAIDSNSFPKHHKNIEGWDVKPLKDAISNHAERAVVYRAAKEGIKTEGLTMVMPWIPCFPCANAIIYSGTKKLISHKQMVDRTPKDWIPELEKAVDLLHRNGVKIIMYDGKVGGCEGFMRGENWSP